MKEKLKVFLMKIVAIATTSLMTKKQVIQARNNLYKLKKQRAFTITENYLLKQVNIRYNNLKKKTILRIERKYNL